MCACGGQTQQESSSTTREVTLENCIRTTCPDRTINATGRLVIVEGPHGDEYGLRFGASQSNPSNFEDMRNEYSVFTNSDISLSGNTSTLTSNNIGRFVVLRGRLVQDEGVHFLVQSVFQSDEWSSWARGGSPRQALLNDLKQNCESSIRRTFRNVGRAQNLYAPGHLPTTEVDDGGQVVVRFTATSSSGIRRENYQCRYERGELHSRAERESEIRRREQIDEIGAIKRRLRAIAVSHRFSIDAYGDPRDYYTMRDGRVLECTTSVQAHRAAGPPVFWCEGGYRQYLSD
jgi:hypothetical protein